ncbi:MAG: hypothetical protein KDA90_09745 [Planctomycetaceae bacterium]|nr:hypothetical protein [Planctomycetaceae bacterium]
MAEFDEAARDVAWVAPEGTVTHADEPIPPQMEFFAAPPTEIGELVSAFSTLRTDKDAWNPTVRMIIALVIALLLWGGTWFALKAMDPGNDVVGNILGGILGLLGLALVYYVTSFKQSCSFVGKQGVARYTLRGSREAEPKEELFEFTEATDLYTGQTRHYYNGVYTGTQYFYRWENAQGRKVFNLQGTFNSQAGTPKTHDPYYFAMNAEYAWSNHLLDSLQAELDKHGSVEFKVNKRDAVRVGPGFMEFCFGTNEERVDGEALKHISIGGGTFSFKTADAKWFSRKGKFSFNYASMANARLFLLVLHSLLGVTFE